MQYWQLIERKRLVNVEEWLLTSKWLKNKEVRGVLVKKRVSSLIRKSVPCRKLVLKKWLRTDITNRITLSAYLCCTHATVPLHKNHSHDHVAFTQRVALTQHLRIANDSLTHDEKHSRLGCWRHATIRCVKTTGGVGPWVGRSRLRCPHKNFFIFFKLR